jgi:RNA polymerase-binding transcription factor DksA
VAHPVGADISTTPFGRADRGTLRTMETQWEPQREQTITGVSDGPEVPSAADNENVSPGAVNADDLTRSTDLETSSGTPELTMPTGAVSSEVIQSEALQSEATQAEMVEDDAHRTAVDAVDGLLDEVELALARLDDGTYGRCQECGSVIGDDELAANPVIRVCVSCSTASSAALTGTAALTGAEDEPTAVDGDSVVAHVGKVSDSDHVSPITPG